MPRHSAPFFSVNCPHCAKIHKHLYAVGIQTNGCITAGGSNIIERVITFACPDSGDTFTAANKKMVPVAIAVEDEGVPESALTTNNFSSFAMTAASLNAVLPPTWTTDTNLILSIQLTNYPGPIMLSTTITGSNGVIASVTNTVTGHISVVRFQTQAGKSYKCQASDDAKQTWHDGVVIVGSGGTAVQYEPAIKTNRIYRVVEL